MAALLESLLLRKVDGRKVLDWLKQLEQERLTLSEVDLTAHKQEFVPFLLNFLRDQSNQALTHGPATPAKTPSRTRTIAEGSSGRRSSSEASSRNASRVQLFSPGPGVSPGAELDAIGHGMSGVSAFSSPSFSTASSPAFRQTGSDRRPSGRLSLGDYMVSPPEQQHSPNLQPAKGRRRASGGSGVRYVSARGGHYGDEAGSGGRRSSRGGFSRISEQVSPPTVGQLNFNNLEDFPPVGASPIPPVGTKPSRRINPTPVSAERPHSKPKTCFTSTPFAKATSPPVEAEVPENSLSTVSSSLSLKEERELLKMEKSKRAQEVCSPLKTESSTPPKSALIAGLKNTPELQRSSPEPTKVTFASDLDLLAELYCTCISENLVPNIFVELFFVMQLLTSQSPHNHEIEDQDSFCAENSDVLEKCYLRQVHNCVYFAVRVLENQFQLIAHLDKCTVRLLAENERVAAFAPRFRDHLNLAQDQSTTMLSPSVSTFIHSVPFQPSTDNRSNFNSDRAFHTFKKQRDMFYEVLREWEDFHKDTSWIFDSALGSRIRTMMSQLTSAGNHSHFARLFLKQLIQVCKGPTTSGAVGEHPDADLLGIVGAKSLGRLKRLEERLIQPQGVTGPCPPPSFPGHQRFFRDFLQTASCCQLNQHLQDSLCQQLLQLDEVSILSGTPSVVDTGDEQDGDVDQQDEKQRFTSVLLLTRLLAKFLGFISFLPYQTSEKTSNEVQETAIALRSRSVPVLDVCAVLANSVKKKRTILTVPWLVEFLSMLDFIGPFLDCYRSVLGSLLLLYKSLLLSSCGEMCYLNKLLLVSVLGWLFQIPVIPEDIFFTNEFTDNAELDKNTSASGLDCFPLVDQQLLYTCCPFLGEFRKLLAAFVSGSTSKNGGIVRKIKPTSAEFRDQSSLIRYQHKLQEDLEEAFFHNQPPSLRRTVEFVAERVGSNAVKHMKATLFTELLVKGEKMLRDGLESPKPDPEKLKDVICAQLCEAGMEALSRATRFCCEKSPEAIRILLPDETSTAILTTSENITKHLATKKACSWLSAKINEVIQREWKNKYDRIMKSLGSSLAADASGVAGLLDQVALKQNNTPKRKEKLKLLSSCPPSCNHGACLPSDVLIQIKDVLSVAVGPRFDEELPRGSELKRLIQRVEETLACRKFSTAMSDQMLQNTTVLLACKLVSAELPLTSLSSPSGGAEGDVVAEPSVRELLELLIDLWDQDFCVSPPLHLLFSQMTVTAVVKANNTEWNNYLFLIGQLDNRGLLSDQLVSQWKNLKDQLMPVELPQMTQTPAQIPKPLLQLQIQMDMLQVSEQTVEGAT